MSEDVTLVCPIEPYEMPKPLRRGFDELVGRVVASAAAHGLGNDLLLRVYLAGFYHGVELSKRGEPVAE
jgi:hypothetical protein